MEVSYFFSVLAKRKWLLLSLMLVSALTTAFLVGLLPKKFKSSEVISSGITDFKGVRVGEQNAFVQEFEIVNKFANLVEYMKSRQVINAVTQKLMLHDFGKDTINHVTKPFRKVDWVKAKMPQNELDQYFNNLGTTLSPENTDIRLLNTARTIEKIVGYDYETLREKIDIKRVDKSDYLTVEFTSENPELTYFVTKTYVDEFLKFFKSKKDTSENKSVVFYNNLTDNKKHYLDSLSEARYKYAKNHGVVALVEQSQAIVSQIRELETVRNEEVKKFEFYSQSAKKYEQQQKPYSEYIKSEYKTSVFSGEEIISIGKQIEKLEATWVNTGMKDANIKKQIDDLKAQRTEIIKDKSINDHGEQDPARRKNDEVFLRLADAEATRDGSQSTLATINKRISELESKKTKLINDNAEFGKLTQQIDIAQKEYEAAFDKKNQADVIEQSGNEESPIKIIEPAVFPFKAEPSKRALISAFSGIGAGTLGVVFLFGLAYFDRSLSSRFQYAKYINLPLLGALNKIEPKKNNSFDAFFHNTNNNHDIEYFKESLRKIRLDIESSGAQSFLFVSLKKSEGKSFLISSLAYSLSLKNKKVLIIDTNFKNNTLSGLSTRAFVENDSNLNVPQHLNHPTTLNFKFDLPNVDIIGNRGSINSPSELLSGVDFDKKVNQFKKQYDYIFMEAACLSQYSDARELATVVDKVIPIFDATTQFATDDKHQVQYLVGLNGKILGSVLNKVDIKNLD